MNTNGATRALAAFLFVVLVVPVSAEAKTYFCRDEKATIVGTNYNDTIKGTKHFDVIVALGGDDTIYGNNGIDYICAGDGNDRVMGGSGNDYIRGGTGSDSIDAEAGNDDLYGGPGADRLLGKDGADQIYGNSGDDELFGDRGQDQLYGGYGNDLLEDYIGTNQLYGDSGNDVLNGSPDLRGGDGDDIINAGDAGNSILAGDGDDAINGGAGQDYIEAGQGDDYLDGGPDDPGWDKDRANAGKGNDFCTGFRDYRVVHECEKIEGADEYPYHAWLPYERIDMELTVNKTTARTGDTLVWDIKIWNYSGKTLTNPLYVTGDPQFGIIQPCSPPCNDYIVDPYSNHMHNIKWNVGMLESGQGRKLRFSVRLPSLQEYFLSCPNPTSCQYPSKIDAHAHGTSQNVPYKYLATCTDVTDVPNDGRTPCAQ